MPDPKASDHISMLAITGASFAVSCAGLRADRHPSPRAPCVASAQPMPRLFRGKQTARSDQPVTAITTDGRAPSAPSKHNRPPRGNIARSRILNRHALIPDVA